jgi:4-amino-4-deoxy-L-arabinose transferase-like glycosyltransferase
MLPPRLPAARPPVRKREGIPSAMSALPHTHSPSPAVPGPVALRRGGARSPLDSDAGRLADPAPRAAAWLARHAVSLAVLAGLLAVAGAALATGIAHYPAFSDDEGTYVAQAWAVRTQGALGHYTYWYDHPPLGWLQLAALDWLLGPLVGGGSAVAGARELMLVPALAGCALLYVLARRLGLRRGFAAAAVLLFVLSPLAVSSLRAVYLDNLATPWLLAAFALAASPRRRLWAYAASGACFAVAVLSKETVLVALPGLLLAVVHGVDRRTRAFCVAAFASVFVLVIAGYPLYALLKGELLPGPGHVSLLDAIRFQLWGRRSTGSALASGSLSREVVESWLRTDPWLLGMGALGAPAALAVRRLRPVAVALLALVAMGIRPGYLPQPYVIALLPLCALIVVGLADAAWGPGAAAGPGAWARRAAVLLAGVVLAAAIGPRWNQAATYAARADQTSPGIAAQRWIVRHVHRDRRLLVDDSLYVDLVRAGFEPRYGVVWFFKLDFTTNLDPSVHRRLPRGWRSFDYVVSTPVIRAALRQNSDGLVQVRRALRHSRAVVSFGSGRWRVTLRRVNGRGPGAPARYLPRRARGGTR